MCFYFVCLYFYFSIVLLLLLSHFSRVRLCATPYTAPHPAPPSLGFSRQEHLSGLPFPSPTHGSEVAQSCPTLSDPTDCSLPGSSVHGIFQARGLEWGAIAFSFHCSNMSILYFIKVMVSNKLEGARGSGPSSDPKTTSETLI